MSSQITVGIVGASGYTGEELVRLLRFHPRLELVLLTSRQKAGRAVKENFPWAPDHLVYCDLEPSEISSLADVFFLALPHGESRKFVKALVSTSKIIIDLSADFRIKNPAEYKKYYGHEAAPEDLLSQAVYGQPETNKNALIGAHLVACAGCYPTSVILPLAPLLEKKIIQTNKIIISSLSGISGAGRRTEEEYSFCECNENIRVYGGTNHRHIPEIEQELTRFAGEPVVVQFLPHLVPLSRGIYTTIAAQLQPEYASLRTTDVLNILAEKYVQEPFVRVLPEGVMPRINAVAHTNRCDISALVDARTGNVLLFSALDNLIKGAGGQAVQCLNLLLGWEQSIGLPR